MKINLRFQQLSLSLFLLGSIALGTGCSSGNIRPDSDRQQQGVAAPVIVNPRVVPQEVLLTSDLESEQPVKVFADIKTFGSDINKAKLRLAFSSQNDPSLRFLTGPVEIEMKNAGGTTWSGELSKDDLKKLAISGETLIYEGNVIAQNDKGLTTISGDPIEVVIEAPVYSEEKH